jgi:uncharacterized protein YerC
MSRYASFPKDLVFNALNRLRSSFLAAKDGNDVEEIINGVLTYDERMKIGRRIEIANMLLDGCVYENIEEKFLLTKRCIIPATGFYEWKSIKLEKGEEKYPFYIYLKNRNLFGFAGLYNTLKDAEGKPHYTFAILTCPSNSFLEKVHSRMPCILEEKDEESWLNPDNRDFSNLYKLLKPYPKRDIKFHPVSKDVNNPKNDTLKLIANSTIGCK